MTIRVVYITGFDEYGKEQSELIEVGEEPVTSKFTYAFIGPYLPSDYVPKIGEWFWK